MDSKLNDIYTQFVARMPKGTPPELVVSVANMFGTVSAFKATASSIRADSRLSQAGQSAQILEALNSKFGPDMRRMAEYVQKRQGDVVSQRSGLWERATKTKEFAPEIRAEVRGYLRSLTDIQRLKLIAETGEAAIFESVLNAPAFLSGVDAKQVESLRDRVTELRFPEEVAGLNTLAAACAEADAALQTAEGMMRREAQISAEEFTNITAPKQAA